MTTNNPLEVELLDKVLKSRTNSKVREFRKKLNRENKDIKDKAIKSKRPPVYFLLKEMVADCTMEYERSGLYYSWEVRKYKRIDLRPVLKVLDFDELYYIAENMSDLGPGVLCDAAGVCSVDEALSKYTLKDGELVNVDIRDIFWLELFKRYFTLDLVDKFVQHAVNKKLNIGRKTDVLAVTPSLIGALTEKQFLALRIPAKRMLVAVDKACRLDETLVLPSYYADAFKKELVAQVMTTGKTLSRDLKRKNKYIKSRIKV